MEMDEMPENEEPCWLCGRAGFSKIDDLESDRELPAALLGWILIEVFFGNIDEQRPRLGCLEVGAKEVASGVQGHTRATQPCGRLRVVWICR